MACAPTKPKALPVASCLRKAQTSFSKGTCVLLATAFGACEPAFQSTLARALCPARCSQRCTIRKVTPKCRATARCDFPPRTKATISCRLCSRLFHPPLLPQSIASADANPLSLTRRLSPDTWPVNIDPTLAFPERVGPKNLLARLASITVYKNRLRALAPSQGQLRPEHFRGQVCSLRSLTF